MTSYQELSEHISCIHCLDCSITSNSVILKKNRLLGYYNIILGIAGRTADPPSGSSRGSSAVNSLNRFSQNNEPEMNQLLDDRARFAAEATKTIAARWG